MFKFIFEAIDRIKFFNSYDRLGPDIFSTHLKLYFKSTMRDICKKKFKSFGMNSEFRPGAYAEACSKISIGKNVVIRPGTYLYADPMKNGGEIIIEDNVLLAPCIQIYTNNHKFSNTKLSILEQGYPPPTKNNSVIIRAGSWIGGGVVILPGVEIGRNSVVGAGSIVTKSIPAFAVCVGNPAKILRKIKKSYAN